MLIRILYINNKYDMVKDIMLNELITSGKITKFYRSDGWVNIGHDPIRGIGVRDSYSSPKRRRTSNKWNYT
jgi:hypothetical protein